MALEFTWSIPAVKRRLATGEIYEIDWVCTAVDGDHSSKLSGTTLHNADKDAEGFVDYNSVTKDLALSWVYGSIDKAEMETLLTVQIAEMSAPSTGSGVPW